MIAASCLAVFLIFFNISGILPVYFKDRELKEARKHAMNFDDLRQPTSDEDQWVAEFERRKAPYYMPTIKDENSWIV